MVKPQMEVNVIGSLVNTFQISNHKKKILLLDLTEIFFRDFYIL